MMVVAGLPPLPPSGCRKCGAVEKHRHDVIEMEPPRPPILPTNASFMGYRIFVETDRPAVAGYLGSWLTEQAETHREIKRWMAEEKAGR